MKKILFGVLILLFAITLASAEEFSPLVIDFEGNATLDDWDIALYEDTDTGFIANSPTIVSDKAHSGNQSLFIEGGARVLLKLADEPVFGTLEMWVYDRGASQENDGSLSVATGYYGPRWGLSHVGEDKDYVAVNIGYWSHLNGDLGYGLNPGNTGLSRKGVSTGLFDRLDVMWYIPQRQVEELESYPGAGDGIGKWSKWTFDMPNEEIFRIYINDDLSKTVDIIERDYDMTEGGNFDPTNLTGFNEIYLYGGSYRKEGSELIHDLWVDDISWEHKPFIDLDNDSVRDEWDNCLGLYNPSQTDSDEEGIGNACDICEYDADNDADNDTICGDIDNCINTPNTNQSDLDIDSVGDVCDNAPNNFNPFQEDFDGDSVGDAGDNCMFRYNPNQNDIDEDGTGDLCDNCVVIFNSDQEDNDGDSWGNSCDNCEDVYNPIQLDSNNDNIGDLCEDPWCVGADLDKNHEVDLDDFIILKNNFGRENCTAPIWCSGADMNKNGAVDLGDFSWLKVNFGRKNCLGE